MPTNDKEYQKKYMKRYREMMKEAKRLRLERVKDLVEMPYECQEFHEQVVDWLEGRMQRTFQHSIAWDAHMCECPSCARWFVRNKRSAYKIGVNLFQKKD